MRVLVACEFSGTVRDAFRARGHDAWSCDLLPTEADPQWHLRCDVRDVLTDHWDLVIAHPPCDHLAVSGARWFAEKRADGRQQQGIDFFMAMVNAPAPRHAIENPVGIMSRLYRKPDQIIQPYEYGHPESKKTCLWLKGLPKLTPTEVLEPEWALTPAGEVYRDAGGSRYSPTHYFTGRGKPDLAQMVLFEDARERQRQRWANQTPSGQNKLGPSEDRWKLRSLTYPGIAAAMADQWGALLPAGAAR